jgi:hypothetical protein
MQRNDRRLFQEEMFDPTIDDYDVVPKTCLDGQGDWVPDDWPGVASLFVHPQDRRHSPRFKTRSFKSLTGRPIRNPLSSGPHNGLSDIRRPNQPRA